MRSDLYLTVSKINRLIGKSAACLCFLICLSLLVFSVASANAEVSPRESVEAANAAYSEGAYQKAVEGYRNALRNGLDNGHLRYNLANAHYRLEEYGQAILNYRRALKLLPGNADISANLALARKQIGRSEEPPRSMLSTVLSAPFRLLTEAQLHLALLACYAVFFVSITLAPLLRNRARQVGIVRNSSIGLALLLAFLVFGTKLDRFGERELALTPASHAVRPGVVVKEKVEVRSGNGEDFQVVFVLHQGAEVETGEMRGDWIEIFLPQGRRGWLPLGEVEII